MSLFDRILQPRWRFYRHLMFWLGLYFWISFSPYDDIRDHWQHEMTVSLFWVFFAMVEAYFVSYRIFPRLFNGTKYIAVLAEFIIGSYLICVLNRVVVIYVMEPIVRTRPFGQESIVEILTQVRYLFSLYFIHTFSVSLVFIFMKMLKDQYQAHKRVLESEKAKAEAELNALKSQLNPHFLFNTLNNIYSLSVNNAPGTSKAIAGLSDILDHLLYRSSTRDVPVSQEVSLLNNYLSLEKLRYDEKLQVIFNHAISRDGRIAPLILLSLAENAFKHLSPAGEISLINIDLKLKDDLFEFMVSNTFDTRANHTESGRIGLKNIRKQLQLIYPGKHSFSISQNKGIFIAYLSIELDPEQ